MDASATDRSFTAADYEVVFRHAPDALLLLDVTGIIEGANRLAERLLGGPASRLRGISFQTFLDPIERRSFSGFLAEVARGTYPGQVWDGAIHRHGYLPLPVTITAASLHGPADTLRICCALRRAGDIQCLAMCASCKSIRTGATWTAVERVLEAHGRTLVSHGLCPRCERRMASTSGAAEASMPGRVVPSAG